MKNFPKPLFYLIQWTWGLPVNIFGVAAFLICKLKGYRTEKFANAYITYVPWKFGGIALGLFIFVRENHPKEFWTYNVRIHEYGHTWQVLLLGPLFWLVIGLPSFIWCHCFEGYRRKRRISYYTFYPEKWANYNGQKATGLQMKIPEDPLKERSDD